MKRLRVVVAYLVVGLTCLGLGWELNSRLVERTTTSRLSPDETFRASLTERSGPARNFHLRIENLVNGESITAFRSPDEGGPPGSERLIWARDGTKLLLVGRHFFVRDDLFLDNGDQLYFLYDLPTGRGWCNSANPGSWPPLAAGMIEGIEFTEPVRRKLP
jgi:hypothetical protein